MTVAQAIEQIGAFLDEARRNCPDPSLTVSGDYFFTGRETDEDGDPIRYDAYEDKPGSINSLFATIRYTASGIDEDDIPTLGIYLTIRNGQVDDEEWEEEKREIQPELDAFYHELAEAPDLNAFIAARRARMKEKEAQMDARREAQMKRTLRLMVSCGIAAVVLIVVMILFKAKFG